MPEHAGSRDAQITCNVGLYYVCYRLSRLGWNVVPTAHNARGVDIIAYNNHAQRFIGVQVKTLSRRAPVPLKSLDGVMGNYWVIVSKAASPQPETFILLPEEVRQLAHRVEQDGRVSFWLEPREYEQERFREKWQRIGYDRLEPLTL